MYALLLHYGSIIGIVVATSLGIGFGGSKIARAALNAVDEAPYAYASISRNMIIALAMVETAAIIGVVLALMLLFTQSITVPNLLEIGIAELGIFAALGISGAMVGIISGNPAQEAMTALARQPLFAGKIQNILLITLSFIQTPVIFSFLISLFIRVQSPQLTSITQSISLLAAGLAIGISSIGSALGLGFFAQAALKTIGYNRTIYKKLISFVFISQAIIETPLIFGLIIAVFIAFGALNATTPFKCITYLCSAFAIGVSTFGPSIQSGRTASAACIQIGKTPEQMSQIARVSVLVQGLIDAPAIYALIIALFIIFI